MRTDTTQFTDLGALGVTELSQDELRQTEGGSLIAYLFGWTIGMAAAGGAACAAEGGTIPVCGA